MSKIYLQEKLTAGDNITIDSTNKISADVPEITEATQSAAGLMPAADKKKLDGITLSDELTETGANVVPSIVIYKAIDKKQDKLTFDTLPTSGSNNPVTSDGIYEFVKNEVDNSKPHKILITDSGTFNPADYGLNAGDTINVTCVGGGGGGGGGGGYDASYTAVYYITDTSEGGSGGNNGKTMSVNTANYYTPGEGGHAGAGYGAGGGGGGGVMGCWHDEYPKITISLGSGSGGSGGEICKKSITLANTDVIAVTIGQGGAGGKGRRINTAQTNAQNGGTSSFGSFVSASGGLGGNTGANGTTALYVGNSESGMATDPFKGGDGGNGYSISTGEVIPGFGGGNGTGSGIVVVEW